MDIALSLQPGVNYWNRNSNDWIAEVNQVRWWRSNLTRKLWEIGPNAWNLKHKHSHLWLRHNFTLLDDNAGVWMHNCCKLLSKSWPALVTWNNVSNTSCMEDRRAEGKLKLQERWFCQICWGGAGTYTLCSLKVWFEKVWCTPWRILRESF